MNSMRLVPTRRAPTVEDARRQQQNHATGEKKKPPPRPPPPNFNKAKSRSAWNLNQDNTISLIEWSPPGSPKANKLNGSISSSFSSSTSSLASSKRSYEYETVNQNDWLQVASSTFYQKPPASGNSLAPTIIRAAPPKKTNKSVSASSSSASTSRDTSPLPPLPPFIANYSKVPLKPTTPALSPSPTLRNMYPNDSPPMPSIPPPSPPKNASDIVQEPFGVALYDYCSGQPGDLQFQVNDIIYLIRKVNDDWYYGRLDEQEGMFPRNFIDVQVPLDENANNNCVTARFDFAGQMQGDLPFKAGDCIRISRVIDANWLEGECKGKIGQFPANFVDRIPNLV